MRALPAIGTALAVMLSGCELTSGGPATMHGVFVPRHRTGPSEAQNAGSLAGILELDRSCLWIRAASGRYLAIWPPGTTVALEDGQAVVSTSRGAAKAGDRIAVGGGERKDIRDVQAALGRDAPDACQSDLYWLVSTDGLRRVNE